MKAQTKTRPSVLRMTLYRGHTLMPGGAGRWTAWTPAGSPLGFGGRTEFSFRHVKILVRLAIALRAR